MQIYAFLCYFFFLANEVILILNYGLKEGKFSIKVFTQWYILTFLSSHKDGVLL